MFRVGSECVQSMFRVYQSMFSLVVKIVVIAVSSASSVSVFGIFSFAFLLSFMSKGVEILEKVG